MEIYLAILASFIVIFMIWEGFFRGRGKTSLHQEEINHLTIEKNQLLEDKLRLRLDLENISQELGKKTEALEQGKSEKDKQEGRGRQIFIENTNLQNDTKHLRNEGIEMKKTIANFLAKKQQKEHIFDEKLKKLEQAQKSLEDEKNRIQKQDEDSQKQIFDEQTRIWSAHENVVLSQLREICQKPEIAFQFFENTSLPIEFSGSLKPDFLINFLGQYLVFDAKFTNQKNANTYFVEQVKKTAKKYKESKNTYPVLFFVIPENRIQEIKKTSFVEDRFSFFIIPPSALEPIIFSYKRISDYEKISDFDPKDREAIISLISRYDRHISFQNAANILLAKESISVMSSKDSLQTDVQKDIEVRKRSMRPVRLQESHLRNLAENLSEQESAIKKMMIPASPTNAKDTKHVKQIFSSL